MTGKIHRKCDLRSRSFHHHIPRTGVLLPKTPYALFLEDDGPYSRKLFRPLAHRDEEEAYSGRKEESSGYLVGKEMVRIISYYV